ncbi:MAG: hypothetical protein HC897_19175, partial [Thermoanaerobaculia bacterium]|nr:hypothetical protein [Thermoanaerobaculia bacterium]
EAPETVNTCGNRSRKVFYRADRYLFDFSLPSELWLQFDSALDHRSHGVWVNKGKRQVLHYFEGDIYFIEADSAETYDTEIEALCNFYEPAPAAIVIDETTATHLYQDRAELFIDPTRAAVCLAEFPATARKEA